MKKFILLAFVLASFVDCLGQRKVTLKKAETLKGSIQDGVRVDWVVGGVVFEQNQTTIYCDSAIFDRVKNSVEAYGRVRIVEGDSVTVTASRLTYDGNKKIAYLRKNVVFTKLETATLYTDFLDFDRTKNIAKYFNRGKLVDSTNTLTSVKGYYNLNTNIASFKNSVVGVNKDNTLRSDTLQYSSRSKVIFFRAYTQVEDKQGGVGYYEHGQYDTRGKISNLTQGDFETSAYRLRGTKLFLDDVRKFYRAQGNVAMTSKEENMTIYGDDGFYDKKALISKVYGHAFAARVSDDQDTIFISADTLVSIDSPDPKKKRLLAYRDVRIFKNDLQGKADSLVYQASDSTIYFYGNPVLWTEGNQMTADSISVLLVRKKINKIYMVSTAFVSSTDSLKNFNQIKGRKMTAYFDEKNIHHVNVEGNGESIYFALQQIKEKANDSTRTISIVSGMNKIICSNMRINFKAGKINNISFYVKPDASFIPPHELRKEEILLKGFSWRAVDRPTRGTVVQRQP
ncbi:MAG: OstA-like protein [Cytophagales bacterium]|nr:OstA-like protein [Cytophagales bacterium]